jgi:curved DNA-binding protein CbpA
LTVEDPSRILGVPPGASAEEIRAAYLRQIKKYPPDRAPAEFERVRDAYEILRDPRRRIRDRLFSGDPLPRFETLLDGRQAQRRFVGPKPWLAVLRGK